MTQPSFNLIDEPFIPVVMASGLCDELSLRDTLARAHEIRELRDESPLVTIALHRLLLAILHRNFGPASYQAWKSLWDARQFDQATLSEYFEKWHNRFDLFHPQFPFCQTANLQIEEMDPAARLVRHVAQTFTDSLFNHTIPNNAATIPFAEAARHLIVEQTLSMSGGAGYVSSHAAYSIMFLATGRSLFETLLLNLVRYDEETPIPSRKDAPTWELNSFPAHNRPPVGYIESLTWLHRQIRIVPADVGVRQVAYVKGPRCEHTAATPDPMLAYRVSKQAGVLPYGFTAERSLWRDSATLFMASGSPDTAEFFRPSVLEHLMALSEPSRNYLNPDMELNLRAYGILGKNASIEFWRVESLPMPLAFLGAGDHVYFLRTALTTAETAGDWLFKCARSLAGDLLAPDGRKPDPGRALSIAKSLAPERAYWSRLEQPYRRLLHELAHHPDEGEQLVAQWTWNTVRLTAMRAFDEATAQLDHSARTLRAVARSTSQLRRRLHGEFQQSKEFINDLEQSYAAERVAD